MEPLKEMFNLSYYRKLGAEIKTVRPDFRSEDFVREACMTIPPLSLNQRLRLTTELVHSYLCLDFRKVIALLREVVVKMPAGYQNLFFCDYVALYGKHDFEFSMESLSYFTRFGSAEFAVREFLRMDLDRTLLVMKKWSSDNNHHVRRLSSEGSRPRLPWSFKLDAMIKEPSLTKEILENLKADPEPYVRKSVANHLNDISKDNPMYMLNLIQSWDLKNPHTAWIIRHASRSLIKMGHADSLSVFSFEKDPLVSVKKLHVSSSVKLGGSLVFDFELVSGKQKDQKLAVDYIIHYKKKSGALSPKVFKLKEMVLSPDGVATVSKKQMIRDFTTRKHFKGAHLLEIQINGRILARRKFMLHV